MVAQIDSTYLKTRPTKTVTRLISYAFFEGRPLTTCGQWINPLVFANFGVWRNMPQLRQGKKPVFILGTGRSGTKILGVVLSMHRDVGFLNEPKALWHAIYPNEDVIGNYSRGGARYRLDASDATETVKRNAHRLFGAYLGIVFSRRLVDKYPELIFRIPFVKRIFPDAKFILLARNGWDVCWSINRWCQCKGVRVKSEVHDWWGVNRRKWKLMADQLVKTDSDLSSLHEVVNGLGDHSCMAAVEWIVTMREGLRNAGRYPDSILMLRYEDLVSSPKEYLRRVQSFCGFPSDETFLAYGEKVLIPQQPHPRLRLPSAVRLLIEETMEQLGYVRG